MSSINQLSLDSKDAWTALLRRPLRSLLSSLGIGIGVAALVAMLSISEGAKQKALAKIVSLGISTLRVEDSLERVEVENQSAVNLSQGLTESDADRVRSWLGRRAEVAVYARNDNILITAGTQTTTATVLSVSEQWFAAEKLRFLWGRPLNVDDGKLHRNFCVIGSRISNSLRIQQPTTLRMQNYPMTVIGGLAQRGRLLTEGTGLSSLDFDNTLVIPVTSSPFMRELGGRKLLDGMVITLNSSDERLVLDTAEQIEEILLVNHRGVQNFQMVVPLNLLREARESQRLFSLVMGSIAGLSLLVGGIGVMNVMLANISEQTREIGLRMAVGASRARIISLYLWNSILLTVAGGIWGSAGGIILAGLVQKYAGWDVAFSILSLIVAPLSAIVTGLVFGLHPAMRAASLDPAIALRDA